MSATLDSLEADLRSRIKKSRAAPILADSQTAPAIPGRYVTGRGRGSANKQWVAADQPSPRLSKGSSFINASTSTTVTPTASATQPKSSAFPSRTKPVEHFIDGTLYVSDPSGRKLVRKDAPVLQTTQAGPSTPNKVSIAGKAYVRTKSGNLIAKSLVDKRAMSAKRKRLDGFVNSIKATQHARHRPHRKTVQRKATPCRFFTKTGECRNALTCPYQHDSAKLSICPKYLRNTCEQTEATCLLSHTPNANRMPHCVHFPTCKLGSSCIYPHVHVASDASVCKDFALLGWCDKGAACPSRHVNECPTFSATGTCTTKGCKLPHIIRKKRDHTAQHADAAIPTLPVFAVDVKPSARPGSDPFASRIDADLVFRPQSGGRDAVEANTDFITFDMSDIEDESEDASSVESEDSADANDVDMVDVALQEGSSDQDEDDFVASALLA